MRLERMVERMASAVRNLLRRPQVDAELDEEVRGYVEMLADEKMTRGLTQNEARREAKMELGGVEQVKEQTREVRAGHFVETLWRDLQYAARMLRKNPGFTIVAVLTLALGIGANTAVFSAIDAILLRPLPFPDGDQLMQVSQYNPKVKSPNPFVAPIRLEDWNRMNSTFQALTGYYAEDDSETSGALPEKITIAFVSPRFLQVWGVAPELGRDFSPEEERVGGAPAALISNRYWRRRFGENPKALGKQLRIGKAGIPIVGIMPSSFLFPDHDVDVWLTVPIGAPYTESRDNTWYTVVGRLKKGVTLAQARANLGTVQLQLGKQYPKPDADIAVNIQPLKNTIVGDVGRSFWMLFGAVSLLLLIACTNIAALLLARSSHRRHEISIRFALGASQRAILRQLLTETFLLALVGAALGLVMADAGAKIFQRLAADLPRVGEIHLDATIVLYTLVCSVVVTLLCGFFPALRATREGISASLAQTSAVQVSSRHRLQWLLVGVQVALAVMLLAGAGLLVRSFEELARVSPGFEPTHILTFHISASYAETADMKGLTHRIDGILDSLRALPGISETATSATLPGVPSEYAQELKIVEGPIDPNHKITADSRSVSPDYFATMQIPLLDGEVCREQTGGLDVMVNRSFANTYFPQSSAVGHHLQVLGALAKFYPTAMIRGIVGDAREEGLNHAPEPTVYFCFSAPMPDPYYLVRTHNLPMTMAETVRKRLAQLEPGRSVFGISPLSDHLSESFSENRLRMFLLAFFAATAIALACIGLYGTLSYSVAVRKREIGLRIALGAMRGQIATLFLFKGLGVCALGCAAGLALAIGFSRLLAGMLYGVSPTDVLTLSAVVVMVLALAAVASLVPAVRASRVNPMTALRYE
ncbi:MAG TPA: ABC transporter permease [Candidatus Acidoferrales bacterium]|nr:ABC transporter permease [Candidatus Acidoferrales bacterium]